MKAYREIVVYSFIDGTQLLEEDIKRTRPSSEDRLQVFTKGDRLIDISFKEYRSHEDWWGIAIANNIIDPWEDLTGTQLIIPAN